MKNFLRVNAQALVLSIPIALRAATVDGISKTGSVLEAAWVLMTFQVSAYFVVSLCGFALVLARNNALRVEERFINQATWLEAPHNALSPDSVLMRERFVFLMKSLPLSLLAMIASFILGAYLRNTGVFGEG